MNQQEQDDIKRLFGPNRFQNVGLTFAIRFLRNELDSVTYTNFTKAISKHLTPPPSPKFSNDAPLGQLPPAPPRYF